jgi:hypothetical protein
MSRGPGKLQRGLTRLLLQDPEGAWTIGGLAEIVYGSALPSAPEKKHRVALLRMLKGNTLPGTWRLWFEGRMAYLCDPCSDASMLQRMALQHGQRCTWGRPYLVSDLTAHSRGRALEKAADARRWRDASQSERIEIQIENHKNWLKVAGGYMPNEAKNVMKWIVELQAELQSLNVSVDINGKGNV